MPQSANAGPPFLTDNPEPTETGHWEIYAPYVESSRSGSTQLGAGAIVRIDKTLRLLASGRPSFDDAGGKAGFHGFAALGLDF
jgi:hypothetical protein